MAKAREFDMRMSEMRSGHRDQPSIGAGQKRRRTAREEDAIVERLADGTKSQLRVNFQRLGDEKLDDQDRINELEQKLRQAENMRRMSAERQTNMLNELEDGKRVAQERLEITVEALRNERREVKRLRKQLAYASQHAKDMKLAWATVQTLVHTMEQAEEPAAVPSEYSTDDEQMEQDMTGEDDPSVVEVRSEKVAASTR